jgi:antitoxin ParD1/3/4
MDTNENDGESAIRRDQGRLQLRGLLLDGAASAVTAPVDRAYFDGLRERARR